MKQNCHALIAALLLALGSSPALAEPGKLVIIGGGLEPDNTDVYGAFLNARPDDARKIVIIPAASGSPASSAKAARDAMIRHGASPENIAIAKIAMRDDSETKTVDESRWAGNVDSEAEIERLAAAGAIWFTGGDQTRITSLLLQDDGSDTPYLAALRAHHRQGAVIGGTSAGAAIMSGAMIGGGDSMGALLGEGFGEQLMLLRGLHFLRGPLIDQHFGERARLGRLAAGLMRLRNVTTLGIGIDEDTAIVVAPDQSEAVVAGTGYVTVLDARSARVGDDSSIDGLTVGIAANGDTIDLTNGKVAPAWYRKSTLGNEYVSRKPRAAGGMAIGRAMLADVIGEELLDNDQAQQVERHSFIEESGITYRFTQTDESRGSWGRDPEGRARYTVSGVTFAITPISITIAEAED